MCYHMEELGAAMGIIRDAEFGFEDVKDGSQTPENSRQDTDPPQSL